MPGSASRTFSVHLDASHGDMREAESVLRPLPDKVDSRAARVRGRALVAQVQVEMECLVGVRPPQCLERTNTLLSAGPIDSNALIHLRLPLMQARARRWSEDPLKPGGRGPIIAITLSDTSVLKSSVTLYQVQTVPLHSAGVWLLECESEADFSEIMDQLQQAGCIMQDLFWRYRLGRILGKGTTSSVFLAEDLQREGELVAVKVIEASTPASIANLVKEASILRRVRHPASLEFLGLYEFTSPWTGATVWAIVSEFLGGGELFDEVRRYGPMREERAKEVVLQLFSVAHFLHSRGIVHRDIKPENVILVDGQKSGNRIKLADFGLATPEWDSEAMSVRCGSPGFIAPEVLRGGVYGCKVDCFSIGALMYTLLFGKGPFVGRSGQSMRDTLLKNALCRVKFSEKINISEDAEDFLSSLLTRDPNGRLSAEQSLAHPWLAKVEPSTGPEEVNLSVQGACGGGTRRVFSSQLLYADILSKNLCFSDSITDEASLGDKCTGIHTEVFPPKATDPASDRPISTRGLAPSLPPILRTSKEGGTESPPEATAWARPAASDNACLPGSINKEEEKKQQRPSSAPPNSPQAIAGSTATRDDERLDDVDSGPTFEGSELIRSTTPLWAEVQRTLSSLHTQGVLPDTPKYRKYRGNLRGCMRDGGSFGERQTAFYTRDIQNQGDHEVDTDRISAFFTRDVMAPEDVADEGGLSSGRARLRTFKNLTSVASAPNDPIVGFERTEKRKPSVIAPMNVLRAVVMPPCPQDSFAESEVVPAVHRTSSKMRPFRVKSID